jgi:hypothetical protein
MKKKKVKATIETLYMWFCDVLISFIDIFM